MLLTDVVVEHAIHIYVLYISWCFQHAHFIPTVGVGKRCAYLLVHGHLSRQHPFGGTSRFTGPVPANS